MVTISFLSSSVMVLNNNQVNTNTVRVFLPHFIIYKCMQSFFIISNKIAELWQKCASNLSIQVDDCATFQWICFKYCWDLHSKNEWQCQMVVPSDVGLWLLTKLLSGAPEWSHSEWNKRRAVVMHSLNDDFKERTNTSVTRRQIEINEFQNDTN